MEEKAPGRGLECDCGYVAHGEDDDELVAAVQAHAREQHGMELSAELILTLTVTNGASGRTVLPDGAAQNAVLPPNTGRISR
jgi:hypothetical protein